MKHEDHLDIQAKHLIDELSKMPPMVIATAYLYAINCILYCEDVTEKWTTVKQNSSALEKAYNKGYYDALQKQAEDRRERDRADRAIKILTEYYNNNSIKTATNAGEPKKCQNGVRIVNGGKIVMEYFEEELDPKVFVR